VDQLVKATFSMRVVIRADASLKIGTGHVMRCLTLATGLADRGAQVDFICRAHQGNLITLIEQRGFRVITLPFASGGDEASLDEPAHSHWLGCNWQMDAQQSCAAISGTVDWIIVDHYALDHRWETTMRAKCARIMCIDDLADRSHDCDLLLDQSLGRCSQDYAQLVPKPTKLMLGPKYALLRPEFAQWRDASLARRETPQLRHILVTMGGVDADNVTGRVLSALQRMEIVTLDRITVILGPRAPWRHYVLAQAKNGPVPTHVFSGVDNMAELMTSCDLAIGAGGTTTWERCALGIPSILFTLAKNQHNIASFMKKTSAAYVIDTNAPINRAVCEAVATLNNSETLRSYSMAAAKICHGRGIERVISEVFQ
jgi:UDP-2,4-diacetamido-2,4,6-trideoxy-beta-L-altropyranose hydrolase